MFRLVRTDPPTESDFRSQRSEKPGQVFGGIIECQARGLSVHLDRHDSEQALRLPSLRWSTDLPAAPGPRVRVGYSRPDDLRTTPGGLWRTMT